MTDPKAEETQMPNSDETIMQPEEQTVIAAIQECPVCHTSNPAEEKWCRDCGFLLGSTPEGEVPEEVVFAKLKDVATNVEYLLREGENIIGRVDSDVMLSQDTFVSRSHAKILVEPPNLFLEDLGSTNGTFCNDERISPGGQRQITHGDKLRFANTLLEVVAPEAVEAPPPSEELRPVVGILEVESIQEISKRFEVLSGDNSLGRHPSNDICLEFDPYVSGSHALISADEEGIFIQDLNSTNGTFINETKTPPGEKTPLSEADKIKLGMTILTFHLTPSEEEQPDNEQ